MSVTVQDAGRRGGLATSEAKAEAARRNGRRGGRPRGVPSHWYAFDAAGRPRRFDSGAERDRWVAARPGRRVAHSRELPR